MDTLSVYSSNAIVLGCIFLGILLFSMNFAEMLKFKWNIDYFHLHDKICKSRYEAERYRYRIYAFLYNLHDDTYASIYKNYKTTYILFITYFSLFVISFFAVSYWTKIYTALPIYAFIFVIWVVYTTVNGILLDSFNKINKDIINKEKFLYRYNVVYKILNAIIRISNLKDTVLEYSYDKMPSEEPLDTVIEHNIGIFENINNIAKIRIIKEKAYNNLDFVKYLVLDYMSPYYLKYFDNVYIRLPEYSTNIYLQDILKNKQSTVDYAHINSLLQGINENIVATDGAYDNYTYKTIYDMIKNEYPSNTIDDNEFVKNIMLLYQGVSSSFYDDRSLNKYNYVLYSGIEKSLKKIDEILNSHSVNKEYDNINALIHKAIIDKNTSTLDVENNDYIQYFIHNKDVLFEEDTQSYKSFTRQFKYHNNYIYAYLVYIFIVLLLVLHYLYIKVNHTTYSYIVCGCIVIYFLVVKTYSHFNFISNI